jgi:hypothetical protein
MQIAACRRRQATVLCVCDRSRRWNKTTYEQGASAHLWKGIRVVAAHAAVSQSARIDEAAGIDLLPSIYRRAGSVHVWYDAAMRLAMNAMW